MTENKELYDAATLTAVEVKYEGVICASTGVQDYGWNEYYEE